MRDADDDKIDWSLTTWEGARREQMRRWAELPLKNIVAALEEKQEITERLHPVKPKAAVSQNPNEDRSAKNTETS